MENKVVEFNRINFAYRHSNSIQMEPYIQASRILVSLDFPENCENFFG